jgi:hypothetical protein
MPYLSEEQIHDLSIKYELTGGQIENIARKTEVYLVLNNDVLPMATLIQYCEEEIKSSI